MIGVSKNICSMCFKVYENYILFIFILVDYPLHIGTISFELPFMYFNGLLLVKFSIKKEDCH